MPIEPIAACVDLAQVYPSLSGGVAAVRGIDARFAAGTLNVVAGPSGAGKSSLLRLLACLEVPAAGDVIIDGQRTANLSTRARRHLIARRIGYVFQRPAQNLIDYLTVAQNVRLASQMRDRTTATDSDRLLDVSDLAGVATYLPKDLSAGQQQRLALVMAVAGGPALIVADEPTAELDPTGATQLAATITALAASGQTFIVASHDPVLIDSADQLLLIRNGALAATRDGDGPVLVVIDPGGRVQIPAEALAQFPDRRAIVSTDSDRVTFRRP